MPSYESPRLAANMTPEDALMALTLMTTWAMRTGRALRSVPVEELSVEELEAFWADDDLPDEPRA
ncbi:hypothetical protein ACIBF1_33795 [Spirillospora sp. NPDC050679]